MFLSVYIKRFDCVNFLKCRLYLLTNIVFFHVYINLMAILL